MENQTMNSQELQDLAALKQLHKGKGAAAIVCGIISLIGCLGPISFICGVVAIVLGAIARRESRKTTGTTGMVLGIIGVVISLIAVLSVVLMMTGVLGTSVIQYTEKVNVSSDIHLCETVRAAITTCALDPVNCTDEESSEMIKEFQTGYFYSVGILYAEDNAFTMNFREIMRTGTYDELLDKLNSTEAREMEFKMDENCSVTVRVPGTEIEVP